MFWGLIMEPNKRYSQIVEKPFHISQAALDISTGDNDSCQVMVVVDGKNFLLCTLKKNTAVQVPLDLYFKAHDVISFLTNGKCNVHLTGYLDPELMDEEASDEENEEEEEEEVPVLVQTKNKRKLDNGQVDNPKKKIKQDKKNQASKEDSESDVSSDDDNEEQLKKFLEGEEMDTDDNDESFKLDTTGEAGTSSEEDDDNEEEDEVDDEAQASEDEDEEESEEADTTLDTTKDSQKSDTTKLTKSQKKRLKKKLAQQAKQPLTNGVEKTKKEDKKKPAEPQAEAVDKKEKKSLNGGVLIEDLKVGSGAIAKPGKVVQVYYEGRLKKTNKMFDNCNKGPGFKFRLGSKEVISGWDVGVSGMKVGGKRKIVCPPAMAYGSKGSPPVIPPNSTLVFEVELKNVK